MSNVAENTQVVEELSQFDAVVVGAAFAGLYMLHWLREMGMKVNVFEAGSDVGGTWFWNGGSTWASQYEKPAILTRHRENHGASPPT